MCFPYTVDNGKCPIHPGKIGIPVELISIEADNVYQLVARILLQVFRRVLGFRARRVSIECIIHSPGLQSVHCHVPQCLILFRGTQFFAPPEPAAAVFVPGTEKYGYLHAVCRLQRMKEIGHSSQPAGKLLMILATGQDGLHHRRIRYIPGITARLGIARMPTERNHAAPLILIDYLFPDFIEGHLIQIGGIP